MFMSLAVLNSYAESSPFIIIFLLTSMTALDNWACVTAVFLMGDSTPLCASVDVGG